MTSNVTRISLFDNKFNGLPFGEPPEAIDVVIVGIAPASRIYYSGAYSSSNVQPPTCWHQTQLYLIPKFPRKTNKRLGAWIALRIYGVQVVEYGELVILCRELQWFLTDS